MKEPRDLFDLADDTKEAGHLYIRYKFDYYKLHLAERVTNVATFAIGGVLFLVMLSLFLLFTSLALAMYLGNVLGNEAYGFLIVGSIYLVGLALLVMLKGRLIQKPLLRIMVRELFPEPQKRRYGRKAQHQEH